MGVPGGARILVELLDSMESNSVEGQAVGKVGVAKPVRRNYARRNDGEQIMLAGKVGNTQQFTHVCRNDGGLDPQYQVGVLGPNYLQAVKGCAEPAPCPREITDPVVELAKAVHAARERPGRFPAPAWER